MNNSYDCVIVGCGPAGLTASIYLKRAGKNVLVLEKESVGGQMATSPLIENYPGISSISGSDLANNMFEQAMNLGVCFEIEEVLSIKKDQEFIITTDYNTYLAKTVIVASGAKYRTLNIDNEDKLIGNGIHFCVSCDGAFYKDLVVAVVGGGNSAIVNAIYLSNICKHVYVIQNLDKLTCEQTLIDKINSINNVEIMLNSVVTKVIGNDSLNGIEINNKDILNIDGMFVSIGMNSQNTFLENLVNTNDAGFIINSTTDGLFVAGDCLEKSVKQVTTAVSDGTIAACDVIKYLDK